MLTNNNRMLVSLDRYLTTPPELDDEFEDCIAKICSECFCGNICPLRPKFFDGGSVDPLLEQCLIIKDFQNKMDEVENLASQASYNYEEELRKDYIDACCSEILEGRLSFKDAASCIDETIESTQKIYENYLRDLVFDVTILPHMGIDASWGKSKNIDGETYYDFNVMCAMLDAEKFDMDDRAFIHLIVRSYAFVMIHVDRRSIWERLAPLFEVSERKVADNIMHQAKDHPDTIEALYG